MAENITLFVSMLAIFLLVDDINKKNTILAAVTGAALSFIKLSNLPLTIPFYFLYFLKIKNAESAKKLRKNYFITTGLAGILFIIYIVSTGLLVDHKNLSSGAGFSAEYFIENFLKYSSGE